MHSGEAPQIGAAARLPKADAITGRGRPAAPRRSLGARARGLRGTGPVGRRREAARGRGGRAAGGFCVLGGRGRWPGRGKEGRPALVLPCVPPEGRRQRASGAVRGAAAQDTTVARRAPGPAAGARAVDWGALPARPAFRRAKPPGLSLRPLAAPSLRAAGMGGLTSGGPRGAARPVLMGGPRGGAAARGPRARRVGPGQGRQGVLGAAARRRATRRPAGRPPGAPPSPVTSRRHW